MSKPDIASSESGEEVGRVIAALQDVPLDSRFNDWTSTHVPGLPFEVYRTGDEAQNEVVARFASNEEAEAYILEQKARAVIAAVQVTFGASQPAVGQLEAQVPILRKALEMLVFSAAILQQNAEGCAVNHHSLDFEKQGLPGWLHDTQSYIDQAREALSRTSLTSQGESDA